MGSKHNCQHSLCAADIKRGTSQSRFCDLSQQDLLTGLSGPGLQDLQRSSNLKKKIHTEPMPMQGLQTQQDFILSSNAISFVGPTLVQCHARNAQHILPCHTIVFQKYSYLYLQINA